MILASTSGGFRSMLGKVQVEAEGGVRLEPQCASQLRIDVGDEIHLLELYPAVDASSSLGERL